MNNIAKSVQSIHPCISLPGRQAGVIHTIYDMVKAHGGELTVETREIRGVSLLFNSLLSESLIEKIKRLHG